MEKKKLIAYCLTKNLRTMEETDIKALDSIHIAFGLIKNGEVYWEEKGGAEDIARIRAIHPGIKIILSIGGWEADGFSQAAETAEGRKKWAESVIALTKKYGFDGIDVDWEYPCSDKAGIRAIPEDKENFTLLLQEMRQQLSAFEEYKTLSIAAGALKSYIADTHMKEVAQLLDYVQMMSYDLFGGWDVVTGHHAALYASGEGVANSREIIEMFVNEGVPIEKIVMGAAFYTREWSGVKSSIPGSPVKGAGGNHSYDEVLGLLADKNNEYKKYWDDKAKAAYLYNGDIFMSYEDEEALAYKAAYVKDSNMYGMMYWEYGQDGTHTLTEFLRRQLDR